MCWACEMEHGKGSDKLIVDCDEMDLVEEAFAAVGVA